MQEDGILFRTTVGYEVSTEKVTHFDRANLSGSDIFMSVTEAKENINGYIMDGEHLGICEQIRINVIHDLERLGHKKGCPPPENAYYVVSGQPSVRHAPETVYYEIEKTFNDMGWVFTGCPHNFDND